MTAAKLKLVGRYRTWRPGVREGRLYNADGTHRRVLIRPLLDIPAQTEVLQAIRQEAKVLARIQHQDVLRVEHVTAFGGKAALVVEAVDGIDLSHVMRLLEDRHQVIPLRATVEIVAIVAAAYDAATAPIPDGDDASIVHPGPVPGEILIDPLGRVKLAGFRVMRTSQDPPPSPEGYAPPEGIDPTRPSAYGLAALLVELLTGAPPPPPGQDQQGHERTLRRTTTRIAAKVGEAGWEDLVRIVRNTLAFDPQARLGPADFARELRNHALEQRSPRLRTWAPAAIPSLCKKMDPGTANTGLDDPAQAVVSAPEIGDALPAPRFGMEASFGPERELGEEDPSEDMATEVVSAALLARIRAAPMDDHDLLEKTQVAGSPILRSKPERPAALPPALAPPPSLPPLDDAPISAKPRPLGSVPILPPLPTADDAPTVKWTVGQPPPDAASPPIIEPPPDPPTEEAARLATEEAPTAEHAEKAAEPPALVVPPIPPIPLVPPTLAPVERQEPQEPGAIAPEAPDSFGPLDEPAPPSKRSGAWWLLLPVAAALLLGAWTAWTILPGLISSLTPSDATEPAEDLLVDLFEPAPTDPAEPEPLQALVDDTPPEPLNTVPTADAPEAPPSPEPGAEPTQLSDRDQAIAALRGEQGPPPQPEPVDLAPKPEPEPADGATATTIPDADEPDDEQPEPLEPEPAPEPDPEPPVVDVEPVEVAPDATGLFRVEFATGHPDIYELEVKCHQGSAKGPPPLVLNDAGKGPCRVTAFTGASGRMIAWIGLTGPATLTCFEDGQRACN